ncbi:MAG: hypothetical protein JXR77_11445 [Lentisphaeria bacterium]|nr:hypothetical protein [Lentisphaeria bacterium]
MIASNGLACRSCTLSRRCFLRGASGAALGAVLGPVSGAVRGMEVGDPVDVEGLRPHPKVRVMGAVLRRGLPYWLGWPGTSYDVPGHQAEYLGMLGDRCRALGLDLEPAEKPVENGAQAEALGTRVRAERPDALVLILQHLSCWNEAGRLAGLGIPTIIFAPVGTAFTGHVREISRRQGVHVVSSLEFSGVDLGLRMVRALRRFQSTRVLWIREHTRDETVMERLGIKVRRLPRRTFNELFDRMPVTEEARDVARTMASRAARVVEPDGEDMLNAARAYLSAKHLLRAESANALTMDCLGMVGARLVPTPPCMAWSMLQDAGVSAGCEADLFGAVSLMLTNYLFDKPGFMNDPVPETVKNLLIAAHCTCGTRLHGLTAPPRPYLLRSHSESDAGVAMQILWPENEPVTLVRFTAPGKMIVDSGTVVVNVDTPPAGGCRTSFEIRMDEVRDARDVKGFHQVVFVGDHRRDVLAFCQMAGIEVEHSA